MALTDAFWTREQAGMYDRLLPLIIEVALDGATAAMLGLEEYGVGLDWALINKAAKRWAKRYTYDLVTGITQTSADYCRGKITEWIESGAPLDELVKSLEPMFGEVRAQMIATTETTRAYAEGNRISWKESGVVDGVKWRTAVDDRVCDICSPLHEKAGTLDEGVEGYTPPAHVNCRCSIIPVVNV